MVIDPRYYYLPAITELVWVDKLLIYLTPASDDLANVGRGSPGWGTNSLRRGRNGEGSKQYNNY